MKIVRLRQDINSIMEYIVGPVLALLVSAKIISMKTTEQNDRINALEEKIEIVKKVQYQTEQELPKKMLVAMFPITKAIKKLNDQVGVE